jgi:hypothetical protein
VKLYFLSSCRWFYTDFVWNILFAPIAKLAHHIDQIQTAGLHSNINKVTPGKSFTDFQRKGPDK